MAKGQMGKVAINVGRQIVNNPLPALLIAAGVGLLMFNRGRADANGADREHADDEEYGRYRRLEDARSRTQRSADESEDSFRDRLHSAEAAALELKQRAGEGIEAFKVRVKAAADAVSKTASGIGRRVAQGAAGVAGFATDQVEHVKSGAAAIKAGAGKATETAQDFYEDYPLAVGAVGVAVGALIGAVTPLSSLERQKLEGVGKRAARAGADLAERGARAVERVTEKATGAALH